jgi:hypothetical protein
LAAAAWRRRYWWALEEFTGRRGHGRGTAGRGDLWLGLNKDPNRQAQASFTIESKARWRAGRKTIDAALREARGELRRLNRGYRTGYPMAVCYVVPVLGKRRATKDKLSAIVADVIRQYAAPDTLVAAYWRTDKPPMDPTDERFCPGVIFVGRYFKKLRGWPGRFERW